VRKPELIEDGTEEPGFIGTGRHLHPENRNSRGAIRCCTGCNRWMTPPELLESRCEHSNVEFARDAS